MINNALKKRKLTCKEENKPKQGIMSGNTKPLPEQQTGQAISPDVFSIAPFEAYLRRYAGDASKNCLVRVRRCFHRSGTTLMDTREHMESAAAAVNEILYLFPDISQPAFSIITGISLIDVLHIRRTSVEDCTIGAEAFSEIFASYLHINKRARSVLFYLTIWSRYMPRKAAFDIPLIVPAEDPQTGRPLFFRLEADPRFLHIRCQMEEEQLLKTLDNLDTTQTDGESLIRHLETLLPREIFVTEGLQHILAFNVTGDVLRERISEQISYHRNDPGCPAALTAITDAIRNYCGKTDLYFNLLPMLRLNGQITFEDPRVMNQEHRMLPGICLKNLFDFLSGNFRFEPRRIYLEEIPDELALKYAYLEQLRKNGFRAFALIPIFSGNQLTGVAEIAGPDKSILDKIILQDIAGIHHILATHFTHVADTFGKLFDRTIKQHFTALQPAVEWRFNEITWDYLLQNENPGSAMQEIVFKQVYPLYGAIDIRNSTINRNDALRKDMTVQLTLLTALLSIVLEKTGLQMLKERKAMAAYWLNQLSEYQEELKEAELNYFLENEISTLLLHIMDTEPALKPEIESYLHKLAPDSGEATIQRRYLEQSMSVMITEINRQVEELGENARNIFPCYFEKFRTDGVEYDFYIGQSIAVHKTFYKFHLTNLRFLQLQYMINISRACSRLRSDLPIPLESTQLIYVNSNCIDIHFREDERRFDVEGAYNIRYHIVKKRIDKALIKGSRERLTQPGTIAIVYFNTREMEDIFNHIKHFQNNRCLAEETEYPELEPLQGIVGLKALRVTVI